MIFLIKLLNFHLEFLNRISAQSNALFLLLTLSYVLIVPLNSIDDYSLCALFFNYHISCSSCVKVLLDNISIGSRYDYLRIKFILQLILIISCGHKSSSHNVKSCCCGKILFHFSYTFTQSA